MGLGGVFRGIGRGVAWPFRKGKNLIARAIVGAAIRKAWRQVSPQDRRQVMDFLAGSKEKILSIITAAAGILTAFGWVPDIVPLLGEISAAIAAGNWQAAFAVVVGIVMTLMRLFRRLRDDRVQSGGNGGGQPS